MPSLPPHTSFQAYVVREEDGVFRGALETRRIGDLPSGDVLVRVRYSSLNYKDMLSACGHKGVTRKYPHTPGIDAAGDVVESTVEAWTPGQRVIVTGYDLGMNTPGGFAEYIRVPAKWVTPLPEGLTLRTAMAYGTAGLTAVYALHRLECHGLTPADGPMLVTGATGGVGAMAVCWMSHAGWRVIAATRRGGEEDTNWLKKLGAAEVMPSAPLCIPPAKPLGEKRWAAAVDTLGGEALASVLASLDYGGAVVACGNALGVTVETTVFPLILRGASVLGVSASHCPMPLRRTLWQRIAEESVAMAVERDVIVQEIPFPALPEAIDALAEATHRGRYVVAIA